MQKRRLGNSDLLITELTLGSWLTYGSHVGDSTAEDCLHAALDAGINCIDTANVYNRGEAERFLGKALKAVPRDRYVLATKVFFPMSEADRGLSRAQIEKQLDASLERLATDHVDLYQCHRYDHDTPLEETLAALTRAVESGKVRYIGFSEWPVDKIRAAHAMADTVSFVSSQPEYSMLHRAPEDEVIPLCREIGISQIVFSPLAQGVLSGKYLGGKIPHQSRAANDGANEFMQRFLSDEVMAVVAALEPLAAEAGLSLAQLALAWILQNDNVASAIIGASRPAQIIENAGAAGVRLEPDLKRRIDQLIAPIQL